MDAVQTLATARGSRRERTPDPDAQVLRPLAQLILLWLEEQRTKAGGTTDEPTGTE